MPIRLSTEHSATFAHRFLDSYCASGFGTLPKREIDLLVLGLLIDCQAVESAHDAQSLSRQLRLPLIKVKAMLYELHLRDKEKGSDWLAREVTALLKHSKLSASGKEGAQSYRIEVGVSDRLLREEIEALLHRDGHFPNYSFNRDILSLTPDAYVVLIKHVLSETDCAVLQAKLKKFAKGSSAEGKPETWVPLAIKTFITHTAGKLGDGVGDMTAEAFKLGITLLIEKGVKLFT